MEFNFTVKIKTLIKVTKKLLIVILVVIIKLN